LCEDFPVSEKAPEWAKNLCERCIVVEATIKAFPHLVAKAIRKSNGAMAPVIYTTCREDQAKAKLHVGGIVLANWSTAPKSRTRALIRVASIVDAAIDVNKRNPGAFNRLKVALQGVK
jgi:hypothetical protein